MERARRSQPRAESQPAVSHERNRTREARADDSARRRRQRARAIARRFIGPRRFFTDDALVRAPAFVAARRPARRLVVLVAMLVLCPRIDAPRRLRLADFMRLVAVAIVSTQSARTRVGSPTPGVGMSCGRVGLLIWRNAPECPTSSSAFSMTLRSSFFVAVLVVSTALSRAAAPGPFFEPEQPIFGAQVQLVAPPKGQMVGGNFVVRGLRRRIIAGSSAVICTRA